MTLVLALALLAALIWLSLPPRESDRRALLAGFGLTVGWLVWVALQRGLAAEFGARAPLWLLVLAIMGAPLIQLFVWSAVTLFSRPRAPRPPPQGDDEAE